MFQGVRSNINIVLKFQKRSHGSPIGIFISKSDLRKKKNKNNNTIIFDSTYRYRTRK